MQLTAQKMRTGAPASAQNLCRRGAGVRAAVVAAARRARRSPTSDGEIHSDGSALGEEAQARARVLKEVLFKINAKHGEGTIMQMKDGALDVERLSTGCLTLDRATGGGYPRGRIVEVFGPEASGKTTVALHAIAEVQRSGGAACFIDAEHAFDPAYAERLGIKVSQLVVCQPDSGETAFAVMDDLVRSGVVGLVVVDSVSALVPRSEVEGDFGTLQIGSQARLMSAALRKIASNASKTGCTIMFINQLRYKVGVMFGNPETTSGGNALKYYASLRLDVRSKDKLSEAGRPEPIGSRTRVKVVKNKVSPPFETAEFDIIFGEGINTLGCTVDVAKELGVLDARGAHYYYENVKLAQGRDNVVAFLRDNPDTAARITKAVRDRMTEAAAARLAARGGSPAGAGSLDDGELDLEAGLTEDDEALLQELEAQLD